MKLAWQAIVWRLGNRMLRPAKKWLRGEAGTVRFSAHAEPALLPPRLDYA